MENLTLDLKIVFNIIFKHTISISNRFNIRKTVSLSYFKFK